jgi:hypothetical protein
LDGYFPGGKKTGMGKRHSLPFAGRTIMEIIELWLKQRLLLQAILKEIMSHCTWMTMSIRKATHFSILSTIPRSR